ncbi:MAG: response regulator [Gemmatimonadaceae bacterium]|nr:response regulator [Gemmatimonadaceae bacterium]
MIPESRISPSTMGAAGHAAPHRDGADPWNALAGFRRDWKRELVALAVYRFWTVLASSMFVTLLALWRQYSQARSVVTLHVVWVALAAGLLHFQRRATRPATTVCLGTIAWGVDVLFVGAISALAGPAWWFGLVFLAVIGSMAMTTLPSSLRPWILLGSWIGMLLIAHAHALDLLPRDAWLSFDSPWLTMWVATLIGGVPLAGLYWQKHLTLGRQAAATSDYRRVVAASPDPIWMLDALGQVLAMNAAAERVTGRAFRDWHGASFLQTVAPHDHAAVQHAFATVKGYEAQLLEVTSVRPDRETVRIELHLVRVHHERDSCALLAIGRDITVAEQSARVALELAQATEREATLKRTARIVGGLAHELNNPLAAIVATLDADHGESGVPGVDGRHGLDVPATRRLLLKRAHDAQRVLHDLLLVTSPPRRQMWMPVDIGHVLPAAVIDASDDAVRDRRVRINADVRMHPVLGDASLLRRALAHLVRNALEASNDDQDVRIALAVRESMVVVSIIDEGAGLPPFVRERLFEPFVTSKDDHHVGLGLSFAHAVISQHGGTLALHEAPRGRSGTWVTVRLPMALHDASTALPEPLREVSERTPVPERPPHVLVIDDEQAIGLALTRDFTRRGWTTELQLDGERALARLSAPGSESDIDVVICDVRLPTIDGPSIRRTLEERGSPLAQRFLFITGDATSPEVADALSRVPSPVLLKPFALAELRETVERLRPPVAHAAG